jgi:hypothetical protein
VLQQLGFFQPFQFGKGLPHLVLELLQPLMRRLLLDLQRPKGFLFPL